ncbi:hypothetical protein E2C01_037645 [Portunus trituberculatus]|uniref:Uncharacterized protein n=1 Tax=Portunus trituberculatus TaxID=210409 RepID=A0A5B7FF54_PORTR|nr:hypothetical protein [Portunus trituberculatus]
MVGRRTNPPPQFPYRHVDEAATDDRPSQVDATRRHLGTSTPPGHRVTPHTAKKKHIVSIMKLRDARLRQRLCPEAGGATARDASFRQDSWYSHQRRLIAAPCHPGPQCLASALTVSSSGHTEQGTHDGGAWQGGAGHGGTCRMLPGAGESSPEGARGVTTTGGPAGGSLWLRIDTCLSLLFTIDSTLTVTNDRYLKGPSATTARPRQLCRFRV